MKVHTQIRKNQVTTLSQTANCYMLLPYIRFFYFIFYCQIQRLPDPHLLSQGVVGRDEFLPCGGRCVDFLLS